jgi:HEAT repeat protein
VKALAAADPGGSRCAEEIRAGLANAPLSERVYWAALALAVDVAQDEAVSALIQCLLDGNPGAARKAAELLGKIPHPPEEAVRILAGRLTHRSASARCEAAQALLSMGGNAAPALTQVLRTLSDPDEEVRLHALAILEQIALNGRAALSCVAAALSFGLDDPRPMVRCRAAEAAARLPEAASRFDHRLRALLSDRCGLVRIAACRALLAAGAPVSSVIPVLQALLAEGEPSVQLRALNLLGEIGEDAQQAAAEVERINLTADPLLKSVGEDALKRIAPRQKKGA